MRAFVESGKNMKTIVRWGSVLAGAALFVAAISSQAAESPGVWSPEKANAWHKKQPWLVGCNFSPSTAINQLEMWQAATFDPGVIDRELGWAGELGFTSVRVFLHHLPYQENPKGYLNRIDAFLKIADKHHIGVMFVLLDACWDPFPKSGKQREPKPHVHNSGWVQCPGLDVLKDPARHAELEPYIKGVIGRFRADRRVQLWDIFNEPDNINRPAYVALEPANKAEYSLMLIQKAYAWAREAKPTQPITSAVWMGNWGDPAKLSAIEKFMLEQSDVISFHNYAKLDELKQCVENLRRYNRPILCSEYMARPAGSVFNPNLGYMKEQHVGAYNWGFVDGKTQTIYPWDSWEKTYTAEPPLWFHDIFRKDGAAYKAEEVDYIRGLTGKKK
jgi:hypothetical protein